MSKDQIGNPKDASPFALTDLPVELLIVILQGLDSRDLKSARLVSRDWELITRPSFASRHLCRSIFWITSPSLRELDQLSRKFGPYMRTIHIASVSFNRSHLLLMIKNYLHDRRTTFRASRYSAALERKIKTTGTVLDVKHFHLGNCFRRQGWQYDRGRFANVRFLWHYVCNMFSQYWLQISGRDASKLAEVAQRLPRCELKVANLGFEIGLLHMNNRIYGRPAPGHAFEFALFSPGRNPIVEADYLAHVERVLDEAMKRRPAKIG